jgi:GxxExxY protein
MLVPNAGVPASAFIAADLGGPPRSPRILQDRTVASVLAAFFAVHRELGGGFLPGVYHRALVLELLQRGIAFEQDVGLSVFYKGTKVGQYRAPVLVEGRVVVDLRAVARIELADEKELSNCLRASGCEAGLLLNFGIAASFRHVER